MSKQDEAKKLFSSGYNCAQAVACAYADETQLSEDFLAKATSGFGGGMGTREGTCGALTAAIFVSNLTGKSNSRNIMTNFRNKVGGIYCNDIKGNNPEHKVRCSCSDCVKHAVEVLEEARH